MAGKKALWMLGIFCVLALGAFAFWRWYFLPAREYAATKAIQDASSRIPTDLIPVVGTVSSADAEGISIIIERFEQSPSGRYLAREELRFRFDYDTNILMTLRTPLPGTAPLASAEGYGETAASPILAGYEDLAPGSPVTILYSSSDTAEEPVAWRVYFPQP